MAEKLEKRERKEAFNIVLELKPGLQKGLALISFLKYLSQEETLIATDKIIHCIKSDDYSLNQINLVQSFLNELELKEYKSLWLNCVTTIAKKLRLTIKEHFQLQIQVKLLGQLFKLIYRYNAYTYPSLYLDEKDRLIKETKALTNSRLKYATLIALLEHFPLNQIIVQEIACFSLKVLNGITSKNNNAINAKEQVKLLEFLPRRQKISFVRRLLNQIYKGLREDENNIINILDFLSNMADFIKFSYLDHIVLGEQTWPIITIDQSAVGGICSLFQDICEITKLTDNEYCDIINTLVSYEFADKTRGSWIEEATRLTKLIKCPSARVSAMLSILSKSNLNRAKDRLIKEVVDTLNLVLEQRENILLSIQMFVYLPNNTKQKVIEESFLQMACFTDLDKKTVLERLAPYLSHSLVKRAFEIAKEINSEEQCFYTLVCLFKYLNKTDKQFVIKLGLGLLKTTNKHVCVDKSHVIKELIKFIS